MAHVTLTQPVLRAFTPYELGLYRNIYQREGIVSIPDFLIPGFPNRLHDYYLSLPESNWALAVAPANILLIAQTEENKSLVSSEWERVGQELNNPGLSYRFHRTTHHAPCPCEECSFKGFLGLKDNITLLNQVTEDNLSHPHAIFGSMYDAGSFLTLHTDKGNGKVAFVYNLTPDWNPIWGGCLHILEGDLRTVKKVVTPTFNTLTLFHIPEGGVPHYVSPVFPTVKSKRLALSGWFK